MNQKTKIILITIGVLVTLGVVVWIGVFVLGNKSPRSDGAERITNCWLSSCQNPVFSPDGKYLMYTRFEKGYNKGPAKLVKINLETKSEKVIIDLDGDNVNVPFGSWVGNKIVFAYENGIAVANDDGLNIKHLLENKNDEFYIEPVFNSTNVNEIILEAVKNDVHQIKLLELDKNNLLTDLTDKKFDDRLPSWSADGKKILWQRTEMGKDNWKIISADINNDGKISNIKELSSGPNDTDNSWTYDGMILSSRTGNGKVPNIFTLDPATIQWQRITNSEKEDSAASQSPDQQWVTFESHKTSDENSPTDIWIIKNEVAASKEAVETPDIKIEKSLQNMTSWVPSLNSTFQIQFAGTIDATVEADIFELDYYDSSEIVINELKSKGKKLFCYLSAGSWENWRIDKNDFPSAILGNVMEGWEDEKWLDIRAIDILGPIMEKRMDLCKQRGFDGIEFDNVDGYTNDTGFPLSYADQLKYNKYLAGETRKRDLTPGLKNNLNQITDLVDDFDWALNEQCYEFNECNYYKPFIAKGKPVFHLEYNNDTSQFCPVTKSLGLYSIKKNLNLDSWREICN